MYKIKNTRLIYESRISIYTKYFIVPKKISNIKGHRDLWLNNEFSEMQKKKPYAVTCALVYLCRAVSGSKSIQDKVKALFETSSQVIPIHKIGIPINWKNEPLWR